MSEDDTATRPGDDPLIGWRYWLLGDDDRLVSVAYNRYRWEPGATLEAVCSGGGHRAPRRACGCGIYGARDLPALRANCLCLTAGPFVAGEVALWGRVIEVDDGWRASHARPQRLLLVEDALAAERLPAARDALAAYGVPVDTTTEDEVLGDVAAAIRSNLAMSAQHWGNAPGATHRR